MHSESDSIEIMISDEANAVIKELFDSLKERSQNKLEYMKGSEFLFDYVHLMCYQCLNCVGSYIDSRDWIKKQKDNNKSHQ